MMEFGDVLINKLPKELLLNKLVDHKIELIPCIQLPSKAPYGLNQVELKELKKKLNELLKKRYIRQRKFLFGTLVLFMSKKDGKMKISIY